MTVQTFQIFFKNAFSFYVLRLVFLFVVLAILNKITVSVHVYTGMRILLWPAAGVSVAALLLWGYSMWPAVFFAAFVVNLTDGMDATKYFGSNLAATLGPMLAAYLCHRNTGFHNALDRFDDAVRLIIAAVFGGLVTALIGVPGFLLSGIGNLDYIFFLRYWASNTMGILLTAPLILVLSVPNRIERYQWKNIGQKEKAYLGLATIAVILLFTKFSGPIRLYFFFPLIFWPAMRFGQRGVALISFVLTNVVLFATVRGIGPFGSFAGGSEHIFYLLTFVMALQITGLIIAGSVAEREIVRIEEENELRKANAALERTLLELKDAKEAAESSSAAKSAFLANVSHEIRTPLGAVLGFSELVLTDGVSKDDRKKIFEIIKRNGLQLLNVINDILDLSKIEVGKFEIQKTVVTVADIIEDIKTTMGLEAERKDINLKVEIDPKIPKKIYTDPLRLRQVLLNIVGNSVKFTDRGWVAINVKVIIDSNGRTKLAFVVTDTGIGIPADKVKDLFSPFAQVDTSSTRRFGGTGLGLALSQRLAFALGGAVVLNKSTLGQGSEFMITIDPGDAEQIARCEKKMRAAAALQLDKVISRKNLANKRILLVEDNPDNQSLFSYYLRSVGAVLETAVNGVEALQKIHSGQYDAILMDLQMPELDGYETTKILRSEGYKKPIIALSAHAMKEVKERCLANGFDGYISKPVEKGDLIRAVAEFFPDSSPEDNQKMPAGSADISGGI